MKCILFCQNPYAFGILSPLAKALKAEDDDILWYVPEKLAGIFPEKDLYSHTISISDCYKFRADAIFVPGNEVPHYLRGLKVQIFHGFAGEKKGHFRIRNYFDLYLTQGPWFTANFQLLAQKHKDFDVVETGWSKLDPLYSDHGEGKDLRRKTLSVSGSSKLLLYAPTFSPSLTSAPGSLRHIEELSRVKEYHIVVKFHDLTDPRIIKNYEEAAAVNPSLDIAKDKNILSWLQAADLMISDTSSAVYEFLLLNKPLITINSKSKHIRWKNIDDPGLLVGSITEQLDKDPGKNEREWFVQNYHPYTDGRSSLRMIQAVKEYIDSKGIPDRRKLPLLRRRKMNRMFGKENNHV